MKKLTASIICFLIITAVISTLFISGCAETGEIKIGAILPLTGPAAKYGEALKNGIDLGVEEINSKGGIKGRRIAVIYEDSQANPVNGVSSIEKLIKINKVPAIIGAAASSVTLAIAPIAEKNKVVLLSPASSAPEISKAGDYIFRNCASDIYEAAVMAKFSFDSLNLRNVGIFYINNDFGVGHMKNFKTTFEKNGGQIVTTENFEQNSTDFRTQLIKMKNANPQAVYLIGYKEMGMVLKQAGELNIRVQFLSMSMFEDQDILKIAGKIAEGVYYSYQSFDVESNEEVVKKFVLNFQSQYGTLPNIFAGSGYDALKILAYALEKGGVNADNIKRSLYNISNFQGVTGMTTFDTNGDVIKSTSIKFVKHGKYVWYAKSYNL